MSAAPVLALPAGAGNAAPPFKFMTWNIYAHTHTNWAKFAHDGTNFETRPEMLQRHTAIVRSIVQEAPDIAALQEVDTHFMRADWDPLREPLPCGQRLTQYLPFQDYAYASAPEGTAILLKRGVFELDPDAPHPRTASVYACTNTGGKSAIVMWARRVGVPNSTVAVVSVHLKGCPPGEWHENSNERRFLLKEVARKLHLHPAPTILAGDFNVRSGEFLDRLSKLMYKELGMLKVQTPKTIPTSLMSDFKFDPLHRIDYIFLSAELRAADKPAMGKLPGDNPKYDDQGPFGTDKGNGSDHRWISCNITPQPFPIPYAYPPTAVTAPNGPQAFVPGNRFTLLQWNVLSTARTAQYQLAHGNPAGPECDLHRFARQTRIIQTIRHEQPDIAALQDVDPSLIPADWSAGRPLPCGEYLEDYDVHRSQPDGITTAILVRKGAFELLPPPPAVAEAAVSSGEDSAVDTSTVVWLRRPDAPKQKMAVASIQLAPFIGDGNTAAGTARYSVLQYAADKLKALPTAPLLAAGDFGSPGEDIKWLAPVLGKPPLKMKAVDLKCDFSTALLPDLSVRPKHRVDYLFTNNPVHQIGPARFGALPGEGVESDGRGPWGSDPGDGSDHRWVAFTLEVIWSKVAEQELEQATAATAGPDGNKPKRPKTSEAAGTGVRCD